MKNKIINEIINIHKNIAEAHQKTDQRNKDLIYDMTDALQNTNKSYKNLSKTLAELNIRLRKNQ